MRKSFLTFTFFVLMTFGAAFLNSCKESGCDGFGPFNQPSDFSTMPLELTGTNDTGTAFEVATFTNQSLRYDSLGIELTYLLTELAAVKHSSSLVKNVLACDPALPYDGIKEFAIYSDTDYNDSYPAGTDLSEIIRYSLNRQTERGDQPYTFSLFGDPILITFAEAPDQTTTHRFTIEFEMWKTGTQTIQVVPVTIKP